MLLQQRPARWVQKCVLQPCGKHVHLGRFVWRTARLAAGRQQPPSAAVQTRELLIPAPATLMTTAALLSAVATAALSISDRGSTASSAAVGNAWLWTLSLTSALSGLAFSLLTEMYEPQRQQGAVLPQHSHILAKRLINFSGFAALCGLVPLSSLFSGRLAAMVTVLLVLHVVVFMANVRAMQAAVSSFQNQQAQQLEEQGK